MDADTALTRLKEGNRAFLAAADGEIGAPPAAKPQLEHHPMAVVLACSDARAPTELIFGQGLGDLFVIRVAGNVATEIEIASVEYAIAQLDVSLVVVLGHRGCGAVTAAYAAEFEDAAADSTKSLNHLIAQIQPAVHRLQSNNEPRNADEVGDRAKTIQRAVWHNINLQSKKLIAGSTLLDSAVAGGRVRIVGACYNTEQGDVVFGT